VKISLLKKLRQQRGLGFSWFKAIRHAITPKRLSLAWHVLRGYPAIYGIVATRPIHIANKDHVFIADCDFTRVKELPCLYLGATENDEPRTFGIDLSVTP